MIPIHKKGDKQLKKNYRPISLLKICGKILVTNRLITINQSGFRPGDSTTNQLLYFVDESTRLLIVQNASKFVQCSLIFLRHLTRYGMMD